MVSKNW